MNSKVSKKPEYLSVGEAAIKLGLSERTIRDRIKVGEIKAFKGKGDKSYQIPVKEFYESMNRVRSLKFTRSIS
jgi:excisionase family DNA binding protein